jgi:hypothetical protein
MAGTMNNPYSPAVTNIPGKTVTQKPGTGFALGPLEVNVIFTGQDSTVAALACAQSFAQELGARIHLQFAVEVPFPLELERPGVSVPFLQEQLSKVMADAEKDGIEARAHLYLCRDRLQALQQALKPNSLVVIGGRRRWWPTPEGRIARALRAKGHRVIYADSKAPAAEFERAVVAR